ncbi:hypothetical protein OB920_11520 [Halobacteria archaeon HArc-gm2]|nr:hypothetical protein [Halobacteria archaeon HArc-gm2]
MKILDTNLWVFGTLGTHGRATELLDEIERGNVTSAINAHMVQEALDAFDRTPGLSTTQRDAFKTEFLARLVRMTGLIEAPSSRDVSATVIDDRRSQTHVRLLAQILDMQPKDVPILTLAFEHADRKPRILTNDESFASLSPGAHNLPALTLEHVA